MEKNRIVETTSGSYEITKETNDCFDVEVFDTKYVDVIYDKYTYIVGDYSAGLLRLKGFSSKPDGSNSYKLIPDYLSESGAYGCDFYILKRLKEEKKTEK